MKLPQKIISSEASLHPDLPFFYGRRIVESTRSILFSKNFLLSFSSFFFLWISFDFFIIFPLFILQRGGNSVDVGLQTAIFYLPAVVIRPVAGWLTDRFGRLKVLAGGTLIMIGTALALMLLRGAYDQMKVWMALILFFRGTGFAAFYTAFFTYVTDLSAPENRGRVIGLFGVSGLIAHGMAPRTAEIVVQYWSFSGFFLVSGLLSALSLIITAFLVEQHVGKVQDETGFNIFRNVTFSRRNLIILPGAFIFGFAIASFTTFGAPYFVSNGAMRVGSFFLTYGLTAGGLRILFGGIVDRFERWKLIAIFFFLEACGVSLIAVEPVAVFGYVGAVLCGIAHSVLFPAMTAMAVDNHPPQYRGVVTSVFTAMIEMGFSLGSYLLGLVVAFAGYKDMFVCAALFGAIFSGYAAMVGYKQRTLLAGRHLTRLPKRDHTEGVS